MNIDLYKNLSDPDVVYKNITQIGTSISVQIWNPISIEDPELIIELDAALIPDVNYLYIADYGRYYVITNKEIIEGNKIHVNAHVDVMKSFFDSCKGSPVIAKRSTNKYDVRIDDPKILKLPKPTFIYRKIGDTFTASNSNNYVLTLSGKGS